MGLFSPTQHNYCVTEEPVTEIYQLGAPVDGKSSIIKGPDKASLIRYDEVSLQTQLRDGVMLQDVNPSSYIKSTIDEKSVMLEKAASMIQGEEYFDSPEPTPEPTSDPTN